MCLELIFADFFDYSQLMWISEYKCLSDVRTNERFVYDEVWRIEMRLRESEREYERLERLRDLVTRLRGLVTRLRDLVTRK